MEEFVKLLGQRVLILGYYEIKLLVRKPFWYIFEKLRKMIISKAFKYVLND